MPKIADSVSSVMESLKRFNRDLETSEGLRDRLAYVRGWYAVRKEDGTGWIFGPSKFIGYNGMTSDIYLDPNIGMDGRKTESQLSKWFQLVEEGSDLYDELWDELEEFLDWNDKEPSRAARISVLDESRDDFNDSVDLLPDQQIGPRIVDLIVEVTKLLPADQLRMLKQRLSA